MRWLTKWFLLPYCVMSSGVGVVHAEDPTRIADFKDWTVLSYGSGNQKYCYAITWPKQKPASAEGRTPYLLVAHQPGQGIRNQIELHAGMTFIPDSEANIEIGSKHYQLYTVGGSAWATSSVQDNRMVSDMRLGKKLVIKGKVGNGQSIVDSYSLKGFTAAMNKVSKICKQRISR